MTLRFDGLSVLVVPSSVQSYTRSGHLRKAGHLNLVCGGAGTHRALARASPDLTAKGWKNRQHAPAAKLPKKTLAKVNDVDNPAWTEDMLGAPILRRGRGLRASPTKVRNSFRLNADTPEFFKVQGSG